MRNERGIVDVPDSGRCENSNAPGRPALRLYS